MSSVDDTRGAHDAYNGLPSAIAARHGAREKGRARGRELRKYMRTSASAYEIGLSVVVGMVMGLFVDKWFDTAPWGFLWFSLAGVLNVIRTVYILVRKMRVDSAAEQAAQTPAPE